MHRIFPFVPTTRYNPSLVNEIDRIAAPWHRRHRCVAKKKPRSKPERGFSCSAQIAISYFFFAFAFALGFAAFLAFFTGFAFFFGAAFTFFALAGFFAFPAGFAAFFFAFAGALLFSIGTSQQISSPTTQSQVSSTATTSPHTSQENRSPFFAFAILLLLGFSVSLSHVLLDISATTEKI
jgi:hypothetical protein